MLIECPSCKYSADVSKEKVPPTGGNTKCPRCSTVFFVTAAEPKTPEIPSAAARPITQAKHVVDRQRMGQESHRTWKQTGPFDMFQGMLLACGVVAMGFSLRMGMSVMAWEEKFLEKYQLVPFKMGFLNRAYSCVLPTIAIAESIFLVLIVYSYKKRKLLSQHGASADFGIIQKNEVKNAIRNIALFLMAFSVITGIATTYEHDEGAMAIFLCIFIGLLLLVPLFICYLLKKLSNRYAIWLLTAVAIAAEVASFTTLKPIFAFVHSTPLWMHYLQDRLWSVTPMIILVCLSMELYWTLRDFRLHQRGRR